jgi:hypothetical protein
MEVSPRLRPNPQTEDTMRRALALIALIAAVGGTATFARAAKAIGYTAYAKVYNYDGNLCTSRCSYVIHDFTNGNILGPFSVGSLNGSSYCVRYYSLGGGQSCGPFQWNTQGSFYPYASHNYEVYARWLCPNGISYKYSQHKSFAPGGSSQDWYMGNLTIINNGGCLPT